MPHCPNWLKTFFKLTLAASLAGTMVVCGSVLYLAPQLPPVEQLREVRLQIPLKVFSADGKLIGEFGEQKRTPILYPDIPQNYIDALLAAEDDNFFHHHGVDLFGLLRAASQIIRTGDIQSGGSTITMQVARHFFLTLDQTFIRKFNEILLSFQIEHELSKDEILELYANKMFLGKRAYGIQAAANVYYGKNIDELTLAQTAMLVGTYKWPSTRNPINDPESALARRDFILGRMLQLDYIDKAQYDAALSEPMSASQYGSIIELDAQYVAEMVRSEMLSRYGASAYSDGYQVYTTIDSVAQAAANSALRNGVMQYDARHGYRGPEAQVEEDIYTDNEALASYLSELPEITGLTPAVVTEVTETEATVYIKSFGYYALKWEDGLSEARPFMTHSWVGDAPEDAASVVSPGNVIRVERADEALWHLSQLPSAQASLVALDPMDGGIRALSGGFDFAQSRFNRVTSAKRQPGSSIKPFVYTTALENNFTASSIINDAPIVLQDASLEDIWRPENDGGRFYGPTRLREALYLSRNLVSIRLLRSMGISETRDELLKYGFAKDDLATNLSLALGSEAIEPIKLARAYAVFANGGYLVEPFFIEEIRDGKDELVFEADKSIVCTDCEEENDRPLTSEGDSGFEIAYQPAPINDLSDSDEAASIEQTPLIGGVGIDKGDDQSVETAFRELMAQSGQPAKEPKYAEQVLDPRVHFITHSILQDVIKRGTGTKAKALERNDLAGKTGTTNGPRDAWFAGYSPHLVATTWLGFDDNSLLGGAEFGGTAALPIWIDFMRQALEGLPEKHFEQPEGLVIARINADTGERTTPDDPKAIFEYFLRENTPPIPAEMVGDAAVESTINTEEIF